MDRFTTPPGSGLPDPDVGLSGDGAPSVSHSLQPRARTLDEVERERIGFEEKLGHTLDPETGELVPTEAGMRAEATKRNLAFPTAAEVAALRVLHHVWTVVLVVVYALFWHPHLAAATSLTGLPLLLAAGAVALVLAVGANLGLGYLWRETARLRVVGSPERERVRTVAIVFSVVVVAIDFAVMYSLLSSGSDALDLSLFDEESAGGGWIETAVRVVTSFALGAFTVLIAWALGRATGVRGGLAQFCAELRTHHERESGAATHLRTLSAEAARFRKASLLGVVVLMAVLGFGTAHAQTRPPAVLMIRDCTASVADDVVSRDGRSRADLLLQAGASIATAAEGKRLLVVGFGASQNQVLYFDDVVSRRTAPDLRRVLRSLAAGCPDDGSTDLRRAVQATGDVVEMIPNRIISIVYLTDGVQTASGHGQEAVYRALNELDEQIGRRRVVKLVAVLGVRDDLRLGYRRALRDFGNEDTEIVVSSTNDLPSAIGTVRRVIR